MDQQNQGGQSQSANQNQGINPATPPWLTDNSGTPSAQGGASAGDGSTSSSAGASSAGFDPFADPLATTATSSSGQGDQSDVNTTLGDTSGTPPWMNDQQATETKSTVAEESKGQDAGSFDPFANPFAEQSASDAGTAPTSDDITTTATAQDDGAGMQASVVSGDDSKGALDLLKELKATLEKEDDEYNRRIKMHENTILEEQDAIKQLRSERRKRMQDMEKVVAELLKVVPVHQESDHSSKATSAHHSKSKSNAPKHAKRQNDSGLLTDA